MKKLTHRLYLVSNPPRRFAFYYLPKSACRHTAWRLTGWQTTSIRAALALQHAHLSLFYDWIADDAPIATLAQVQRTRRDTNP